MARPHVRATSSGSPAATGCSPTKSWRRAAHRRRLRRGVGGAAMALLVRRQSVGVAMSVDQINKALDELMWQAVQLDVIAMREIRATWDTEDRRCSTHGVGDGKGRSQTVRPRTPDAETRERVMRWQGDKPPLRGMFHVLGLPKMENDLPAAKASAAPAVLDAAAVAIVGEFLSEDERDILQGPFRGSEPK